MSSISNKYDINQTSTGPNNVFANPNNVAPANGIESGIISSVSGFRVTNSFSVCTTRGHRSLTVARAISADQASSIASAQIVRLRFRPAFPGGATTIAVRANHLQPRHLNNPFLVRSTTRVRDFKLIAKTNTNVESWYVQDDWRLTKNFQFNLGVRWDMQQANGNEGSYLKLNNLFDDLQPRIGFSWDP